MHFHGMDRVGGVIPLKQRSACSKSVEAIVEGVGGKGFAFP